MNRKLWEQCRKFLQKEVVPALGCTEPVAVALAAAHASRALGAVPERIEAAVSGNLLKNGMGVGVPGTGMTGLDIAAAVGAIGGDADLELEVLRDLSPSDVERAKRMLAEGRVVVRLADVSDPLYAEITVRAGNDEAKALLRDEHSNITRLEKNGVALFDENRPKEGAVPEDWPLSIAGIYECATAIPFEELAFILKAAELNAKVAEEGLKNDYGLKVGKMIDENIDRHLLSDDTGTYAMKLAAAASDARMDGVMMPVMSNSGSGNQGITCTMPVVAFARRLECGEEKLARALIISHLTSIHIKSRLGRLSALFGATVAATAASCGIVFLLGGGVAQMGFAIKNMVGSIAGMICDGAKNTCALKVAASVSAGIQAAFLAMNQKQSEPEGIVAEDVEQCIRNLGRLGSEGMAVTDKVILDMMLHGK